MNYDVIIIGTGPAGLSSALYAARYKLKALVIGAHAGGAMSEAWKIENYPGFKSIAGMDLAQKIQEQLKPLGVEIINNEVVKIEKQKKFKVITRSDKKFESRSLILALGTQRRKLNVPGEAEFHNKGVAYCATCDAPLFKNKTVAVIGGGDSAIKSAVLLAKYTNDVYLLVRGKELSGEPTNVEDVKKNKKIKIIYEVGVSEIKGDNRVTSVVLNNGREIKLDGVFIEIGTTPASVLIKDLGIDLDERGYIKVDANQKTNIKLVYAAGDITNAFGNLKQVLTSAAQGAVAATSAYKDLI